MAGVDEVEVVVAHDERATLRVGDVFLKIDADQTRIDVEVEAMALAPIPTPEVLWRKPPVLALAAVPGTALGRLGEPSTASSAAWAAAGAAAGRCTTRRCRHGPVGASTRSRRDLDSECEWLVRTASCPPTWSHATARSPRLRSAVDTVFTHGDLQITHVFVDGDEITGVIDWSEAGQAMPCTTSPA